MVAGSTFLRESDGYGVQEKRLYFVGPGYRLAFLEMEDGLRNPRLDCQVCSSAQLYERGLISQEEYWLGDAFP